MPKRANGHGSLQKRGTRWVAALTLGRDEHGKLRRVVRTFDTEHDAHTWMQQHTHRPSSPAPTTLDTAHPDVLSLHAYLHEWLAIKRHHVTEKTWRDYERIVRHHLLPSPLSPLSLSTLRPLHIERLLLTQLAAGRSTATVFVVLRIVKLALSQAVDWGLLPYNPAARVRAPRRSRQELNVWTPAQVEVFLRTCQRQHPRWYALFYLALTTGMRRGELLGLHWGDVDLERGELLVRCSLVQCGARAVMNEPKTRASRRRILLAPDTVRVLNEHQDRQQSEQHRWKSRGPQEVGLVFPSTVGRFQLPCILTKIFHRLLDRADVPRIRIHDLRHTSASLLVRQGVPIKAVAERLGHTDASLTLRVYTHLYDEQRRAAALPLDVLLSASYSGS